MDYELPVYSVDNKLTDAIVFTEKSDALLEKINNNVISTIISTSWNYGTESWVYSVDVTEDSNRMIPIISVASGDLDIYIDGLHQTEKYRLCYKKTHCRQQVPR